MDKIRFKKRYKWKNQPQIGTGIWHLYINNIKQNSFAIMEIVLNGGSENAFWICHYNQFGYWSYYGQTLQSLSLAAKKFCFKSII